MKKITLFLAGLMLVGSAFAGDGKGKTSGCCKGKKEACTKEAKAKCDKGTGCCSKKKTS